MTPEEVLTAYRAKHDIVPPGEEARRFWYTHYEYDPIEGFWVSNDDPGHVFQIERLPDFDMTSFLIENEEGGYPAAYCYRCPALLTIETMLVDETIPRPICRQCKEDLDQ